VVEQATTPSARYSVGCTAVRSLDRSYAFRNSGTLIFRAGQQFGDDRRPLADEFDQAVMGEGMACKQA
jgi:hypothetical protein